MLTEEVEQCYVCESEESDQFRTFDYPDLKLEGSFHLRRCKNCGLVFNSPRLTRESGAILYDTDYYVFDAETNSEYREEARRDFSRVIAVSKPGSRLLEIGCARGHLLTLAQQKGYDVRGVEISEYASKIARASGIPIFTGTLEQTSFEESSFEVIVAQDVLEHVHNPLIFLEIICRYLTKDGLLILETPNIASIFAWLGGKKWIGFNQYHIFLFSPKTLIRLSLKAGLDVVNLETAEANLFSLDSLRRLGMGNLLGSKIRSRIGSWLRAKKLKNNKEDSIPSSDVNLQNARESIISKWLNNHKLGDQLLLYARRSGET